MTAAIEPAKGIVGLKGALRYVRAYRDQVFVVKLGGEVLDDADVLDGVAAQLALLASLGIRIVVVHGGGAQATALSRRLGIEPELVAGRRITDDDGTSRQVDFGHVGDIDRVDPHLLKTLLDARLVPVVASLAGDEDGGVYNVNADTVAEALAVAMGAQKLIFLTGAPGVLRDRNDPATLVTFADPGDLAELMASGALAGGMRPKVEACIRAATKGVERTHIIDGRAPDSLLLEVFTGVGCGTMIVGRKERAAELEADLAD